MFAENVQDKFDVLKVIIDKKKTLVQRLFDLDD